MVLSQLITVCLLTIIASTVISVPCPCEDPSLCSPIKYIPQKEIFIFSVTNSSDVWMKYDWAHISTVVTVGYDSSELMCYAHKHDVRVVTIANFSPTEALANSTYRLSWVKDHVKQVQDSFLDGINFDFEDIIPENRPDLRDGYTALVSEASRVLKFLNPSSQVTVDVAWSPTHIDLRYYDYVGLAKVSDFLFVMSYDEQSQIFGPCVAGANSDFQYTSGGLELFLKMNIPSNKLVLGVPWYGYNYKCVKLYPNNTCTIAYDPWRGVNCSDAVGSQNNYNTVLKVLKNSTSGRLWDPKSQSPYFNFMEKSGQVHQMWYDDPESLGIKYNLVKTMELRGAGMWQADALDNSDSAEGVRERKEMWGAIAVVRP